MVANNIYTREEWDFVTRKVDVRDKDVTIEEMTAQGWVFYQEEGGYALNANPAVLLFFRREKQSKQQPT